MNIVVSGASGFVGQALVPQLRAAGHKVRRLVRREPSGADEIFWRPEEGELDPAGLDGTDAIINLAGENLAGGRWSSARRERILRSRTDATRTLVVAMGKLRRKPRVFLSASAVGYYGDRGGEVLTEQSAMGHGFLPEVCLAWETHAEGAGRGGVRTVILRFGMVLGRNGGALARMRPLFRLGLGGPLGAGRQWMSWIAMDDLTGVIGVALVDERFRGPLNVVAPAPVTNAEFTRILAETLHRPACLPVPGWALHLAFGPMAEEVLLASLRVEPCRLQECGFKFRRPELAPALRSILLEVR
jgi:uncharacterized protein